eukprot:CAMPEP_0119130226 /NCGR_PEP_ID=MMETSP1310-20130426/7646_1 /TAXON_ID=464262 /ORGANISM="Genus nov. species nov., Strain RCC2339" /LENGTH=153 /DNA_ID=CAMNT_0007120711 /DNA_START=164 /DNA_END=626 /DNA_ORIENTATION=-
MPQGTGVVRESINHGSHAAPNKVVSQYLARRIEVVSCLSRIRKRVCVDPVDEACEAERCKISPHDPVLECGLVNLHARSADESKDVTLLILVAHDDGGYLGVCVALREGDKGLMGELTPHAWYEYANCLVNCRATSNELVWGDLTEALQGRAV